MSIETELTSIFKSKPAGVFLFVGSGFSRRYLGLENWKGLLEKFCVTGQPFEYYLSKADGDYPTLAGLLATEFNEYWWTAPEYENSRLERMAEIENSTSALRIEIANYLHTLDQSTARISEYSDEVELLSGLNVDGIITTNWDMFLEELFPEYKTFVGQQELLFANPQQIGEIYKIHGCSSAPASLVLTETDYREFNERNAYLAAKLITIFVEHAIVFIGYSLSDPNITGLLRALSLCIGHSNLEKLRHNLIFVQIPRPGESEGVTDTYLTIDGVQIPLVLVKANNLVPVYKAIDSVKRKIPARLLRFFKEQLYSLVHSAEPAEKMAVIDIDEIERAEDVEFVVGVGVAQKQKEECSETLPDIGTYGYITITAIDLFRDVINDDRNFDARRIVTDVIPNVGKYSKYIPVFKYLNAMGITTLEEYQASGLPLDKWVLKGAGEFQNRSMKKAYDKKYSSYDIDSLIAECTPPNCATFIPFLENEKIDREKLLAFLKEHEEKLDPSISNYASWFKKLTAFYDRLKWGW